MTAEPEKCTECNAMVATDEQAATQESEDGFCYAIYGGQHAETETYSDDWTQRALKAEERARMAEADRDEWKAVAEEGAAMAIANDVDLATMKRWGMATLYADAVDPAAGTGDHEAEPGRMGE